MKNYFLFLCSITILLFNATSLKAQSISQTSVATNESLNNTTIRPTSSPNAQLDRESEIADETSEEMLIVQGRTRASIPVSYYGLGGNIGFSGDSTVGDGAFAFVGKSALTSNLAIHSGFLFGDDNTTLASLTYGVPVEFKSYEILYPFIGGGILIEDLFSDFDLGGLITGGLDVLITNQITGTARLNLGFANDDTNLGLLLGIGLNI